MISHVTFQRSDRNIAVLNGAIVCSNFRIRTKVLLADPKVRFASRIDVLGNYWSGVLDSLSRYFDTFDFPERYVDIQECPFRQTFTQYLLDGKQGEPRRFRKVKVIARHQTHRDAWDPQDRSF